MSAWLCSRTHVAALVLWATRDAHLSVSWAGFGHSEPHGVATMLHQENVKSLAARYPGDFQNFGPPHEFSESDIMRAPRLSTVEVLKACACLEYQSCEHDGWKSSRALRFLESVRNAAIAALPGWDAAPWGIDDPQEVAL